MCRSVLAPPGSQLQMILKYGTELEQVVHTYQRLCSSDWPRGFGSVNSNPHSWIFTSVSVGSSHVSYLFTSAMVRIRTMFTLHKVSQRIYPICWRVTLHFWDQRGAASLRYRNRTEITVLYMYEQKSYPVWFLCWCKSNPWPKVIIAPFFTLTFSLPSSS